VIAALLLALLAQHPIPDAPVKRGTLSFEGRATLGDFVGTTDSVRGAMQGGPDLAAVTGWVEAPVASLRTGNGRRDRDLRKSMEAERFPLMRFDLRTVTPRDTVGDTVAVVLLGTLALHGVSHTVGLEARVWRVADGLRVRSTFPLNVKDFRVGGLTKLLGVLKMDENITVHVDVTFGP
jgi:polyisoprenoid-binding protein YceI